MLTSLGTVFGDEQDAHLVELFGLETRHVSQVHLAV